MPELPEVETVRRTLEHQIINEEIKDIKVYYDKIIENVSKDEFVTKLIGEAITKINRYGKYLIFILNNVSIIAHLRMEGKFFLKDVNEPVEKHEHIIFEFKSNRTLRYHDTRKFGKMALINSTDMSVIMNYPSLKKLGPEANQNVSEEYLYNALVKRHEPIKTALLNQEIIAGLGNIYVDEVCFLSKIHPHTSCTFITKNDVATIIKNAKTILDKAILAGGTTIRSYTSSLGVTGRFQVYLHVHTKEGSPCDVCGTIVKKMVVGGRGTYYCPNCQKEKTKLAIGITGGIAMGKSEVTKYLKSHQYEVVDSDEIVKNLLKEQKVINQIKELFGDDYIENEKVNKVKLGQLIFTKEDERLKLNNLIHPLVKEKIKNKIKQAKGEIIFLDIPLLYEASFDDLCDKVIVVYTDYLTNLERLKRRDQIDDEYAKNKIASQMDIEIKKQKANYIIDNSHDLCYTYKQIEDILQRIKKEE